MRRSVHPLWGGAIKANKVSAFVRCGQTFHVIRPGYDIQGRRRPTWTQVVHGDVPVYTVKTSVTVRQVTDRFDALFDRHIGADETLLAKALELCKGESHRKFQDGVTGESPAPAVTHDKRGRGFKYPT